MEYLTNNLSGPSFPEYSSKIASHQNALDIFDGWHSALSPETGLISGQAQGLFTDVRVTWAAPLLGGFSGKTILELGPFEGYNTYQFSLYGAATVISIEANLVNFLKCLTIKNILNISATFLYGDFIQYLEKTERKVDICWASGVLYHMTEP